MASFLFFIELWNIEIVKHKKSTRSVATRLGCGGMFIYYFTVNLLLNQPEKEF